MAEPQKAKAGKKPAAARQAEPQGSMVFGKRNVLLLVAGILVVIIGYLFLGTGSITAAPILLVLGYCVIIPLSIVLWVKKPDQPKRPDDTTPSGTGE
jgi:uncharacterized membrane protein